MSGHGGHGGYATGGTVPAWTQCSPDKRFCEQSALLRLEHVPLVEVHCHCHGTREWVRPCEPVK